MLSSSTHASNFVIIQEPLAVRGRSDTGHDAGYRGYVMFCRVLMLAFKVQDHLYKAFPMSINV